jgi:UDP-2,3-diacylglucosamine pyrophosphatase LpxH
MKKVKLVVSDFHVGKGKRLPNGAMNVLEDFFHDEKFKEFVEFYTQGPYEDADVELIFNGDMLNLIQVDYHGHYPVVFTENVAVAKTKSIIDGHPLFFKTLRDFLSQPEHSITYVIGNHDQEMLWKGAKTVFEEAVGRPVNWRTTHYQVDGLHIEHGHQFEAVNRIDPTRLFLTENLPEPILNLPWGTLFTVQYIVRIKMSRPMVDKVRPFRMLIWWSIFHDTWMAVTSLLKLVIYFISTRFSKNRYRQSSLKMTMKILLESSVFPDLSDAARRILRTPEIHTVVFGHTHVYKHVPVGDNKQYLNTGTWTDIISMDLENYARPNKLTYVRVDYVDDKPHPVLRHWIGRIPLEDEAVGM